MQEVHLWERDTILSKIDIKGIKLLSCDIFDTLVFRTTAKPTDIFEQVGEVALKEGVLRNTISPKEFRELRVRAELKARLNKLEKYNTREVSLLDIYLEFSPNICEINRMIELELEIEKKNIYLNYNVYSFIKHCKANQIKIVLLSDMYLSSKQIEEILINSGADINIFDKIIVSSEWGTSKSKKELYNILLKEYKDINANKVIHIGDNYISDFVNAKQFGINSIHYALDRINSLKYEMELLRDNLCIGELLALRKQKSLNRKYSNEKDNFLYDFGATVLGPIFSIFIDYVVSIVEDSGIKNIHPIMRDGYIFEKMLNEYYKKTKSSNINIKSIYASRKSTFLASLPEINKKVIESYLYSSQLTVKSFFSRFGMEVINPFKEFGDYGLLNTKDIPSNKNPGLTIYDEIINYLLAEDVSSNINKKIQESRKLLISYLEQEIDISKPFMTIDIGYNGTVINSIEKAFNMEGKEIKATHLILIGHILLLNRVLEGIDVRAFIKYKDNEDFFNGIFFTPLFIEAFMSNSLGSVLRYEIKENNQIIPVIDELNIERYNEKEREICQLGIMDFYNSYLDFLSNKPWLRDKIMSDTRRVIWLIERFMKYPTAIEAKYLGDLYSENDFYYKDLNKLCTTEEENKVKKIGPQNYLKSNKEKSNIWPSGVVERVYPNYMAIQLFKGSKK